jgi:hypothetical protein
VLDEDVRRPDLEPPELGQLAVDVLGDQVAACQGKANPEKRCSEGIPPPKNPKGGSLPGQGQPRGTLFRRHSHTPGAVGTIEDDRIF